MVKKPIKISCKWCKKKDDSILPLRPFCSDNCLESFVKDFSEKAYKRKKKQLEKAAKDQRKKDRATREKLKTVGQYEIDAKKVFQKWIRMRDKDLPCISCGKNAESYDGGHYFKSELYSGLIFHEDNCNKQCVYCNQHLHGNESNYRIGLVKKIGEERVRWLEDNKDRLRTFPYSKNELIEIKKKYQKLLKEL